MDLGLRDKVAVVTGGGGAIGGAIASLLAEEGVKIAVWDLSQEAAEKCCDSINAQGGVALAVECNVLDKKSVATALSKTLERFETVDILINGAGGSRKQATTSADQAFFDIQPEAVGSVVDLNYMSAVIPAQIVGRVFAEKKAGVIINISSIAGMTPLSKAIGYCNGKAATNSFTQWLAVHMASEYSPNIRVNAVAPGFVMSQQNRFLLIDEKTGQATERGREIIRNVPVGRYGQPDEIAGAVLWLASEKASFVTGAILPVDGGFTAFSGV